ncbi:MAG: MarR family transcriptional regulator [Leptospirales bacterium]
MNSEIDTTREYLKIFTDLAKLMRNFQHEAPFCEGLTFGQFTILDHVIQNKHLELSKLHGLLGVEKSTTTRLIQPLVDQNFVEKVKSADDSRILYLEITDEGKEIHDNAWRCLSSFFHNSFESIAPGKQHEITSGLKLFISRFDECCGGSC